MRITLCCSDSTLSDKNEEYCAEIGMDTYYFEIDSVAILPIGTIVSVTNQELTQSMQSMQFQVVRHWYNHENNILYLDVDIYDGDMSPKELIQYLKKCWVVTL